MKGNHTEIYQTFLDRMKPIDAAKWLFNYLANNHPETREIIEGYIEAINTTDEDL